MQTMHYALYRLRIHVECLFAFVGTGEKGGYSVKILNGLNTNCDEYIYSRVSVLKVIESQISSLT